MTIGSIIIPPGFIDPLTLNESLVEFQQRHAHGQQIRYLSISPQTAALMVLVPRKIAAYDTKGEPVFGVSTALGLLTVDTDPFGQDYVIDVHVEDC